ncbi:DNA primase [Mitsuokella multacida]|uniref:DNA primase n=1 Tax=Mitsuokella multacida DSM 20544 TaxID=500635 RepID=C9KNW9_9FIRM|nr:DNA primase [Mitsuokella multacida]EEX68465.1 DNA primase [Mitsuokella multacida DSM 20544]
MRNEAMEAFVERVSEQTDILRIVQGYVPLKRRGNRYWGCCPFHQEKTASFSVLPDKGFFYCFGCHAGGNAFKFLSLIENISYFDAIKLQAEKLGIPLPERKRSPQEVARDREIQDLRKVNELARDFFHNCLTMTRMGERGKAYFAARGIRQETIEEFQLGYAPPAWDKLSTAFLKRGIKQEFLLASGLCAERKQGGGLYDRFRGRVIIPIADERGRVVGFGGRVLDDSTPKYLNTPETVLFNKRKLLFGLDRSHRAIQQEGRAIVVEGYMDAISVFDAGVHNVVASLGTAFTPEHAKKLLHYAPEICFCYDSDEAGQKATIRALSIVRDTGARVRVIVVPDGKDPDEFIRKHGADAFRALVEKALPLVEYRLRYVLSHTNYDTLDGKVKALHEMMPVLAGIREAAVRSEYERRLAQTLMLDEGIVRSELRHYRPEAEEAVRQPIRKAVAKADTALRKAGRLVIRMAWQDAAVIAHLETIVPLEGIRDPAQREILTFLKAAAEEGRPVDDMSAATLSDEAAAELSRSLVEDLGGRDETEAYDDSLRVLRKAYLNALYTEHSRKANEYAQNGQHEACLQELNEVNKIKHEMDEW